MALIYLAHLRQVLEFNKMFDKEVIK